MCLGICDLVLDVFGVQEIFLEALMSQPLISLLGRLQLAPGYSTPSAIVWECPCTARVIGCTDSTGISRDVPRHLRSFA